MNVFAQILFNAQKKNESIKEKQSDIKLLSWKGVSWKNTVGILL
jgi:hypothetical protein